MHGAICWRGALETYWVTWKPIESPGWNVCAGLTLRDSNHTHAHTHIHLVSPSVIMDHTQAPQDKRGHDTSCWTRQLIPFKEPEPAVMKEEIWLLPGCLSSREKTVVERCSRVLSASPVLTVLFRKHQINIITPLRCRWQGLHRIQWNQREISLR